MAEELSPPLEADEPDEWVVSVDRGSGVDWEITITGLDAVRHHDGWVYVTDFEGDVHLFSNGGGIVLSICRPKPEVVMPEAEDV